MLKRIKTRIGKQIHVHLFRHSPATLCAVKGWNGFKMNYRYGWLECPTWGAGTLPPYRGQANFQVMVRGNLGKSLVILVEVILYRLPVW